MKNYNKIKPLAFPSIWIQIASIQMAHRYFLFVIFFYFNFMLKRRSHRVRKLIIVDSNKIFAILSDKKWQKKTKQVFSTIHFNKKNMPMIAVRQ